VAELATVLGIERFIATGYSTGGLIAQLLWRRHPDLTSGLVLCASSRNFLGTPAERIASLLAPAITVAGPDESAAVRAGCGRPGSKPG
jgi:3-oxoadipate enol-lactonase